MIEVADYINWGLVISATAFGFLSGWNFGRYRYTRDLLGAVLFILYKCEKRQVWFSPVDREVIRTAVNFVYATAWIKR